MCIIWNLHLHLPRSSSTSDRKQRRNCRQVWGTVLVWIIRLSSIVPLAIFGRRFAESSHGAGEGPTPAAPASTVDKWPGSTGHWFPVYVLGRWGDPIRRRRRGWRRWSHHEPTEKPAAFDALGAVTNCRRWGRVFGLAFSLGLDPSESAIAEPGGDPLEKVAGEAAAAAPHRSGSGDLPLEGRGGGSGLAVGTAVVFGLGHRVFALIPQRRRPQRLGGCCRCCWCEGGGRRNLGVVSVALVVDFLGWVVVVMVEKWPEPVSLPGAKIISSIHKMGPSRRCGGLAPLENDIGCAIVSVRRSSICGHLLLLLGQKKRDPGPPGVVLIMMKRFAVGFGTNRERERERGRGRTGHANTSGGVSSAAKVRSKRRRGRRRGRATNGEREGGRDELAELFLEAESTDPTWVVSVRMVTALHSISHVLILNNLITTIANTNSNPPSSYCCS